MDVAEKTDKELSVRLRTFDRDPYGFVMFAYPWGEPGTLKGFKGPDKWQEEFLKELGSEVRKRDFDGVKAVRAIRMAAASGHGIGKSTLVAWLVHWILATRANSLGTVTANTFTQLSTKTWATLQKWTNLCIVSHWFNVTGEKISHVANPKGWFAAALTCKEENSDAFAGQHNIDSTSFYIFDESSSVPDSILEVAEGGLTDGEPMIFMFGNPTRNSGKFHRVCFGSERGQWITKSIDSRESAFTNKEQLQEWVDFYGEDSDFVRVRIRGLPPSQGDLQFIDLERISQAQKREALTLPGDPLICGVDVARGGGDWNVIRFRRGLDARTIPPQRIPGEETRNSTVLVSKLAEILSDKRPERRVSMMFVDAALGGPVVNRLHQLGHRNVAEINFGWASPNPHQANMRAYMWQMMKDWLLSGAIDSLPRLETDLSGPGYKHNTRDKLLLESKEQMKKRGLDSPDDGDALGLTFAQHVAAPHPVPDEILVPAGPWS